MENVEKRCFVFPNLQERLRAYVDKRLGKTFESEVYALKDEGDENVKGEES